MIMGCTKRVIVVKDTGSDMFDEAYFIVSPGLSQVGRGDFLREANRIINQRSSGIPRKRSSLGLRALLFLSGCAFGSVLTLILTRLIF